MILIKNDKHKKLLWLTACVLAVALFLAMLIFLANYYYNLSQGIDSFRFNIKKITGSKSDIEKCDNCVRRSLDGRYVKPNMANSYPTAAIIDNHPQARPSFGLSQASLVYEVEVEGSITRYLAFFAETETIDKIGPIRSARPYFVDWAKELSAVFTHCGGSPETLVKIVKENLFDLNEFYQGAYFKRDEIIPAPHNIFISGEQLSNYLKNKNLNTGKFLPWIFKDDKPAELNLNSEISIGFKSPNFAVSWEYDIINNDYTRYLGNKVHQDSEQDIKAKNIIIQHTNSQVIDDDLRLKIKTIGSDKATICLDGQCREGKWQKAGPSERTRYYYQNEEEVEFNAGLTWIEIINRKGISVIY